MPRFSIFTRPPSASSSSNAHDQTETGLWRTSTASTNPPPAYTPNNDATGEGQVKDEKPLGSPFEQSSPSSRLSDPTAPALPGTPETMPICPHESLTAARVALIASLPGLKPVDKLAEPKEVDALTSSPRAHHRLPDTGFTRHVQLKTACEPLGRVFSSPREQARNMIRVRGKGRYIYTLTPHHPHDDPMLYTRPSRKEPCLVLCMTWDIFLSSAPEIAKTIEALGQEVEKAEVQLCAHKRLNDPEFLETIYEAVNPDVGLRDPILRYRTAEEGYNCELEPFSFSTPLVYDPCLLRIKDQSYQMTAV
ncbi:MAG: hypothetical protein Q9191_007268 [Dirinaria sp. TL-2023a]